MDPFESGKDRSLIAALRHRLKPLTSRPARITSLADKRHLPLKHVVSASGARYANADESVVFWNKGTTATMTEGTVVTFANCIENPV